MTEKQARIETIKLFGEDSFTEVDRNENLTRYYVGRCPTEPGPYTGFMAFSWEEALEQASNCSLKRRYLERSFSTMI